MDIQKQIAMQAVLKAHKRNGTKPPPELLGESAPPKKKAPVKTSADPKQSAKSKNAAAAALASKLAARPPPAASTAAPAHDVEKFRKMLKMGVPPPAIRGKMAAEGIPPKAIEEVLSGGGGSLSSSRSGGAPARSGGGGGGASGTSRLSPDDEKLASQYRKMVKVGLPQAAIIHKMNGDGIPQHIQKSVLAGEEASGAAPPSSGRGAASGGGPRSTLSAEDETVAAPYRKMMKLGLPQGAVMHKMTGDGVPQHIQKSVLANESPAPTGGGGGAPASSGGGGGGPPSRLSAEEEVIAAPYRKMFKMSLPDGAVMHKMAMDGVPKNVQDSVMAREVPSAPAEGTSGGGGGLGINASIFAAGAASLKKSTPKKSMSMPASSSGGKGMGGSPLAMAAAAAAALRGKGPKKMRNVPESAPPQKSMSSGPEAMAQAAAAAAARRASRQDPNALQRLESKSSQYKVNSQPVQLFALKKRSQSAVVRTPPSTRSTPPPAVALKSRGTPPAKSSPVAASPAPTMTKAKTTQPSPRATPATTPSQAKPSILRRLASAPPQRSPVPPSEKATPVSTPAKAIPVPTAVKATPVPKAVKATPVPTAAKANPVQPPEKATPVPRPVKVTPVPTPAKVIPVPTATKANPVQPPEKATPVPRPVKVTPVPAPKEITAVPAPDNVNPVPTPMEAPPLPTPEKEVLKSSSSTPLSEESEVISKECLASEPVAAATTTAESTTELDPDEEEVADHYRGLIQEYGQSLEMVKEEMIGDGAPENIQRAVIATFSGPSTSVHVTPEEDAEEEEIRDDSVVPDDEVDDKIDALEEEVVEHYRALLNAGKSLDEVTNEMIEDGAPPKIQEAVTFSFVPLQTVPPEMSANTTIDTSSMSDGFAEADDSYVEATATQSVSRIPSSIPTEPEKVQPAESKVERKAVVAPKAAVAAPKVVATPKVTAKASSSTMASKEASAPKAAATPTTNKKKKKRNKTAKGTTLLEDGAEQHCACVVM